MTAKANKNSLQTEFIHTWRNKRKTIFVPYNMMYFPNRIKTLRSYTLAIMLFVPVALFSQQQYPTNYFRSPVDYKILLSGTFGELRGGHFHSGMDIKTGGVSGKNIYAVADGFVSRIKVSANGFGKTLYVTHPNGYISVYAHLSRFNKKIGRYVKEQHYKEESFELNIFPDKHQFVVKKGEVIAYSGNSGGSNGPHLHFEMRLEKTQTPVNPLHFGYEVKDYIRPEIHWLKVIPAGPGSLVDGSPEGKVYDIDGWGEKHRVKANDTIEVSGPFSLAINTYDKLNDASNKNGVYEISLYKNDELVYRHDLEKFDFSETRYINSLIDYSEYVEQKRHYQRTEVDPNNKLSIYKEVQNNGIYFAESGLHKFEYVIKDFNGNVAKLPIVILAMPYTDQAGFPPPEGASFFSISETNTFTAEGLELELAGNCLYRDMWFTYETDSIPANAYSRIHRVHDAHVPVHKYYKLTIQPDSIPSDTDKLLVARIDLDGNYQYSGGKWEDGKISANVRSFGDYTILIDTIPPEIQSVNISSGIIKADRLTAKVKVTDDLSGVSKYRATLNGSWLLMEYDPKNNLLIYYIDERLKKGENDFQLVVTDGRGNEAVFNKTLIRK